MLETSISRRLALARIALVVAAPFVAGAGRRSARGPTHHPDPRPGITAEHVLPEDKVDAEHRDAYAAARGIPEVLDSS